MRGTLGDTQYPNTLRKIGRHRNTVSKIDEIPMCMIYDGSHLLKVVSISHVILSQACKH